MRLSLRSWLILIVVAALVCVPLRHVVRAILGSEIKEEQAILADLGPQWSVHGHRISADKPLEIVLGQDYNRIGWLDVGSGPFDDSAVARLKDLHYLGRLTFNDTAISPEQLNLLRTEIPRLELR